MALKERLRSEASLQPILAQFVPLEVDLDTADGRNWTRRFRAEGSTIPQVFVVRADGTPLHAKSFTGGDLAQFLTAFRPQAGALLTPKQLEQIAKAIEAANQSLAAGDTEKAVITLSSAGGSGSYAAVAVEADKLIAELVERARTSLDEADEKLSSEVDPLAGAVQLAEASRVYRVLVPLKAPLNEANRKWNKDPAKRVLLAQGTLIDKASQLALQKQARRAVEAYQLVVTKYPATAAAELAQAKIQELGSEAATAKGLPVSSSAVGPDEKTEKAAASNLRLAQTFAKTRPDKAREYAQKVIDAVPETDLARAAQELIAQLPPEK